MLVEPTTTVPPGAVGVTERSPAMVLTLVPHTQKQPTSDLPAKLSPFRARLVDQLMDTALDGRALTGAGRIHQLIADLTGIARPASGELARCTRQEACGPHRRRIAAQPPAPGSSTRPTAAVAPRGRANTPPLSTTPMSRTGPQLPPGPVDFSDPGPGAGGGKGARATPRPDHPGRGHHPQPRCRCPPRRTAFPLRGSTAVGP